MVTWDTGWNCLESLCPASEVSFIAFGYRGVVQGLKCGTENGENQMCIFAWL